MYCLLDSFSATADIRNSIIAFDWKVPAAYWKARLPKDLFFELENVKDLDAPNWKSLCLGFYSLLEESSDVRNRERVLGVFKKVSRRFVDRDRAEAGNSTPGDLNQVQCTIGSAV